MIKNIKIKSKLIIMILIPVLGLCYYSFTGILDKLNVSGEMSALHDLSDLAVKISNLVHELQKERGMSAGFIGSLGRDFRSEIVKQRVLVDEKASTLQKAIDNLDIHNLTREFNHSLNQALTLLKDIKYKRNSVMALTLTLTQAIDYFSKMNDSFFKVIAEMSHISHNAELVRLSSAYVNFLQSKERADIERAVLTNVFETNRFGEGIFKKLITLINEQNNYTAIFKSFATPEQRSDYDQIIKGSIIDEVNKMRNIALQHEEKQKLLAQMKAYIGYGGLIHIFKNYVLRGREKYVSQFNDQYKAIIKLLSQYKNIEGVSSPDLQDIKTIEQIVNRYKQALTTAIRFKQNGKNVMGIDQAIKINDAPAIEASKRLSAGGNIGVNAHEWFNKMSDKIKLLKKIENNLAGDLENTSTDYKSEAQLAFIFYLISTLAILAITAFLVVLVIGNITKPLNLLMDVSNKVAGGDFNVSLDVTSGDKDEIGQLLTAQKDMVTNLNTIAQIAEDIACGNLSGHLLNDNETGIFLVMRKMVDNLTRMLREIIEVTSSLSASSEELNATANALAEGAQNQAATVEESTATTEELAASIKEVSDNAGMMKGRIDQSLREAKEFKSSLEHVSEEMLSMSDMAEKIGEIVKVINDIADQTKLLSLNAAIEAARAGEHGRGFAVVAEAISSLANSTAESTKDIRELIKGSIRQIHLSVDQVKKSSDSLDTIVSTIEENNRVASEIARSMEDQYESSEQIQITTEGINQLTQTVSASAEEMSASTNELGILSERLNKVVNAFNIDGAGDSKGLALPDSDTKMLPSSSKVAYIVWDDSYSVNIKEIDRQHLVLVDLINQLHEARKTGQSAQVGVKILEGLRKFTDTHFNYEEELLKEHGYPGYEEQLKLHIKFVDKLREYAFEYDRTGRLPVNVMEFLKSWLMGHIKKIDMKYVKHMNDRGIF
ncbi:MAG: hypothetical protein IEMM0008_0357 [bacterium]|nr:MAG: hypothetical protein IEMM0008_0357 [bacterium]